MSRKSKIRWSKKDKQEVTNAVRNFNSKITRTLKKNPELADYLPSRITTAELIAKSETRQDFKRELNAVKRFMQKGAELPVMSETGIQTTKWEKKEIGLKVASINRSRTIERKKADVSTYKGTMGSIENAGLKPKNYNIDKIKARDWEKFKEAVDKQIKATYGDVKTEKYKENYLKAMQNVFGSEGKDLFDRIQKIPADRLIRLFYDNPILQIDFVYDPQELDFLMEAIGEHLEVEGF